MSNKIQLFKSNWQPCQEKKQFKKRIKAVLKGLEKIVNNPKDKNTISRFRDCLIPTPFDDVGRLPYYSLVSSSKTPDKIIILFCLISVLIQRWWEYQKGNSITKLPIEVFLSTLENITTNGLNKYEIKGNVSTGYYLFLSVRGLS